MNEWKRRDWPNGWSERIDVVGGVNEQYQLSVYVGSDGMGIDATGTYGPITDDYPMVVIPMTKADAQLLVAALVTAIVKMG